MITIELYEMARQIAGVAEFRVEAGTLREALAALCSMHPELDPDVVRGDVLAPVWRAGLHGKQWITDPDHALEAGARIVLVSAIAGG